jgi:hypothetical protein
MTERERLALHLHRTGRIAPSSSDERDLRAAREEGYESGFMAGLGTFVVIALMLGLLFFLLSRIHP